LVPLEVVFKEDVDVPRRALVLRLLVSVFFLAEPIAITGFSGAFVALGAGAGAGGGGGGGATGGRGGGVGATYGAGAGLDPKHIRFHPFYLLSIPPRTVDLRDTSQRLCRLME
tara:strand:+ start:1463 stop:1801 length:339 start_codon:yes stop_codon:yes gene_type:complete